MYSRAPRAGFDILSLVHEDAWSVDIPSPVAPWFKVQSVLAAQEISHKQTSDDVWEIQYYQRRVANRGASPEFNVEGYVWITHVRKCGVALKLVSTWGGLCRVVIFGGNSQIHSTEYHFREAWRHACGNTVLWVRIKL